MLTYAAKPGGSDRVANSIEEMAARFATSAQAQALVLSVLAFLVQKCKY